MNWLVPVEYIPLRKGILEHLISGKLRWYDYAVYTVLLMLAEPETGMVCGISTREMCKYFLGSHQRIKRDMLEGIIQKLERQKYIKRFFKGINRPYDILINKYYIAGRGLVDAAMTNTPENIAVSPMLEIVEMPKALPAPKLYLAREWCMKLAEYYHQNIKPCHPPAIAAQIDGIDCEQWLIEKCTFNYKRFIDNKKTPMEYRMQAKNFYRHFEFLTYQDANMEKLIQTPEDIFDSLLKEEKNKKLKDKI